MQREEDFLRRGHFVQTCSWGAQGHLKDEGSEVGLSCPWGFGEGQSKWGALAGICSTEKSPSACAQSPYCGIEPVLLGSGGWRGSVSRETWVHTVMDLTDKIRSVAQSCPTLCDPMNCSTPGLPVHHQLPEFTHVHWVGDAIQPSHPLSSPSPPARNPSQHQILFQWVNSSHEMAKVLEFQLWHQSFQRTPRTDLRNDFRRSKKKTCYECLIFF